MSCGYCENFDPNSDSNDDRREGWYGRPSGMQYELNGYVGSPQGPNAGPKTVGGTFLEDEEYVINEHEQVSMPTPTNFTPVSTNPTPNSTLEGWYNMISGSQYEMNSHVSGNSGPGWGPKHSIQGCVNMLMNPFVLVLIILIVGFMLGKKYKKF